MASIDRQIAEILGIIHLLEDPVKFKAYCDAENARRRARQAAANARFARSLSHATDIQMLRIEEQEASGYKVVKLWEKRVSGRIAVMCQKDGVWDEIKMKMGTKLTMVYPDGRRQSAFGKVPIQDDWF